MSRTKEIKNLFTPSIWSNNSTGIYRVHKEADNKSRKGYFWRYSVKENGVRRRFAAVSLDKLKEKIEANGYKWIIIDGEKAKANYEFDREMDEKVKPAPGHIHYLKDRGKFRIDKWANGKKIYYGQNYASREDAEKVFEKLYECDWDKSQLSRIREELGV